MCTLTLLWRSPVLIPVQPRLPFRHDLVGTYERFISGSSVSPNVDWDFFAGVHPIDYFDDGNALAAYVLYERMNISWSRLCVEGSCRHSVSGALINDVRPDGHYYDPTAYAITQHVQAHDVGVWMRSHQKIQDPMDGGYPSIPDNFMAASTLGLLGGNVPYQQVNQTILNITSLPAGASMNYTVFGSSNYTNITSVAGVRAAWSSNTTSAESCLFASAGNITTNICVSPNGITILDPTGSFARNLVDSTFGGGISSVAVNFTGSVRFDLTSNQTLVETLGNLTTVATGQSCYDGTNTGNYGGSYARTVGAFAWGTNPYYGVHEEVLDGADFLVTGALRY